MADLLFSPSSQPILNCLISNLNWSRIDVVRKELIGAAAINGDELITNANPLVLFINLSTNFYNLEGANRIINFCTLTPNIIYAATTLATGLSNVTIIQISFNIITFSGAIANAGTTLSFNGYRVLLNT